MDWIWIEFMCVYCRLIFRRCRCHHQKFAKLANNSDDEDDGVMMPLRNHFTTMQGARGNKMNDKNCDIFFPGQIREIFFDIFSADYQIITIVITGIYWNFFNLIDRLIWFRFPFRI